MRISIVNFGNFEGEPYGNNDPKWNKKLLRIEKRSPEEMIDLAEYLHKTDVKDLFIESHGLAYVFNTSACKASQTKLQTAINKVLAYKLEISKRISELEGKKIAITGEELSELGELKAIISRMERKALEAAKKFKKNSFF